jgi:hypothetical protein
MAVQLRERAAELEAIDRAVQDARAGRGVLLAVEGPAGIGKTSLLAAARERAARSGSRVLSARGSELERDFAGGVVRQLFEPVLYAADDAERERWFAGAAALAQPFFDADLGTDRAGHEEEVRFRRRHGLYWLVANLAREGPVVVAVDDAQWADEPSLGFIAHLATRVEHLPVLLLVGCRPHAEGVSGVLVQPGARVLRPAALSHEAVGRWVRETIGQPTDAAFVDACHRATGGNPFLVGELLHEVQAEALDPDSAGVERLRELSPRGVATSVLLRLAGLPASAAALARAAAVLGEAELAQLAALAEIDSHEAVRAAGALSRAGVLAGAEPVRFVHPVVRTVLYEDIPAPERALAHARAARLLHASGAAAQRIAAQLVLAGPMGEPWALEALRAAAAEATLRGGPEVAARLLERALAEPGDEERFELMLALGRAEVLAGRPGAEARLRAAVALARTPADYARATVKLGRVLRFAVRAVRRSSCWKPPRSASRTTTRGWPCSSNTSCWRPARSVTRPAGSCESAPSGGGRTPSARLGRSSIASCSRRRPSRPPAGAGLRTR